MLHRGRQEPGGTREEQTLRQGGHICSLVHWVLSALEGQAGKRGLQRGHLGASAFRGAHARERFEERAALLTPRREEVRRGSASCPALRRPHTAHSGTWRQLLRRPRKPRGGTSLHSLVLLVQRGTGLWLLERGVGMGLFMAPRCLGPKGCGGHSGLASLCS